MKRDLQSDAVVACFESPPAVPLLSAEAWKRLVDARVNKGSMLSDEEARAICAEVGSLLTVESEGGDDAHH